ncbi:hypothetical protein Scep_017444 [Stephania cephalantha]|uniref:CCHC-type domain-containing protein n=1 Tax=Stephania cephalantha TaxID=152367 RepID=A0AAP0NWX9_9MAGN
MSDEVSSSGLEIPVTTAVPCAQISSLAPAMTSRLPFMSLVVVVPPTIVPDFASRSSSIVQQLHQFQQAEGRRDRYVLGQEQRLISRSTEMTGHTRHMTCGRCGQEGHIMSCDPQSGSRFLLPPQASLVLSLSQIQQTLGNQGHDAPRQGQIQIVSVKRRRQPTCYRCRQVGHMVHQCPQPEDFLYPEIDSRIGNNSISPHREINARLGNLNSTEKTASVLQM